MEDINTGEHRKERIEIEYDSEANQQEGSQQRIHEKKQDRFLSNYIIKNHQKTRKVEIVTILRIECWVNRQSPSSPHEVPHSLIFTKNFKRRKKGFSAKPNCKGEVFVSFSGNDQKFTFPEFPEN